MLHHENLGEIMTLTISISKEVDDAATARTLTDALKALVLARYPDALIFSTVQIQLEPPKN
jgi:CO dehydrogenase/acetyl-CoA synthase gamma subunit (corrinoid Fe-S protein)